MPDVQYLEDLMSDSDASEEETDQMEKATVQVAKFVEKLDLADPKAVSLGALKRFVIAAGFDPEWVQKNRQELILLAKPLIQKRREADEAKDEESESESEEESEEASKEKSKEKSKEEEAESEESESESESESEEEESESEEESEEEEKSKAKKKESKKKKKAAIAAAAEVEELLKEKGKPRKSLPKLPIKLSVDHTTSSKPSSPFILHFPNAPPPEATLRNQRGTGDKMEVAVHYCKDKRRAHHRVVLGETERMEYVASNFGSKNEDSDLTKFVVGVLDKKTMTMKLVESAHLFAMQQNIKEYKDTASAVTALEGYDAQKELVNIFGGKKSKRNLGIAERYRVESTKQLENQLQSSISKTSIEVQMQASIKETVEKRERLDLPPYHLDAPDRANIYRLDEIISEEHWDLLEQEGASLAEMSASDLHALMKTNDYDQPACVLTHLPQLASKKGRAKKKFAAKLMYLTYLVWFLKFFKNNARANMGQLAKMTGVPEGIVCQFVELFTQQEQDGERVKYSMGRMLKMRLIHYILVVNLIIANFSMRLDHLCKDLLFDDKKISQHCASIGCKVTRMRKRARADTPKKSKKAAKKSDEDDASEADDTPQDVGNFDVPPGTQVARLTHPLTFPELRVSRTKQ